MMAFSKLAGVESRVQQPLLWTWLLFINKRLEVLSHQAPEEVQEMLKLQVELSSRSLPRKQEEEEQVMSPKQS